MGTPQKIKQKWRGSFNYSRQAYILYCYAYTERQAWVIMCRRLAKMQGVVPSVVMNYFNGSIRNYEITIETEYKEVKENETDD